MAFTPNQQILELVRKSRQILVVFKKDWSGDALAGSLALAGFFRRLGKKADIVCDGFKQPANFSFLPTFEVKTQIQNLQKFVISIDTAKTGLAEFEYDHSDSKLNIFITPTTGQLAKEDLATSLADFKYDLIFLINTSDLESLGEIYHQQPDFFYLTPKINIDHHHQNEHYGNINLVNLAAASTSEIVYDLIANWDSSLIDEDLATYILTGLIAATKNFKTPEVTPHTLNLAGILINQGARREQIVQSLYQSRFLSTLKLWGRLLSRLNNDLDDKMVWSSLSREDFLETATSPDELIDVIDELIVSMPKTEVVILLYEEAIGENIRIQAVAYSAKNLDAMFMARKFNPQGSKELAKFIVPASNLAQAEHEVLTEIKKQLA